MKGCEAWKALCAAKGSVVSALCLLHRASRWHTLLRVPCCAAAPSLTAGPRLQPRAACG